MTKIRLTITIAVALLVVSLAFVASAAATQTRTVPSECINPGDGFTVTINCPGTGGLVDTLCDGWAYTGSSLPADQVDVVGNVVTFKLVGDTSFTYTVEAPDTPDTCCTISGFFRDMDAVDHPLDDDTVCTCPNGAITATRTVPSECINPDDEFTVTINCPGTGGLVDTLCDGWAYTGSSLPADQVDVVGNVVTFKLVGDTSFTYTVEAPDTPDTCCTISGFFRDMDAVDHPLDDDTVCTCPNGAITATRTVPSECINPDDEFTVTINCPGTGGLVDTLCDGWAYTGSSLPADQVDVVGNVVTFKLVGDTSFTYTVEAPDTPDTCCTISGFFRDMDAVDHPLDDDTVCTCPNGAITATRTVPSECINPDDEFTVTINCPGTGGLVDTLCDGWAYTGSSLPADQVDVVGNVVTFKLVGDTSFTYTVEAPDTPDTCCTISGFFRDMDAVDHPLDDDTVCTCTDNDLPTVTVTYPTSGTVSGTIAVTADANDDPDGTVTQVEFFLVPGSSIGTDANGADGWSVPLDTTTVTDGDYQIKAVATDNDLGTGDDTGGVFAIDNSCQCDFCLDLDAGWNLVSVPRMLDGPTDAKTVFNLSSTEMCEYYDGCTSSWSSASPSAMQVIPGRGYMVSKASAEMRCLNFDDSGTAIPSNQKLCADDWNMIGFSSLSSMSVADFETVTALDGKFTMVWHWNSGWEMVSPPNSNSMVPGKGYLLWMTDDGVLPGMIA